MTLKDIGRWLGIGLCGAVAACLTQMSSEKKIEETADEIYTRVQTKLDSNEDKLEDSEEE